MTPRRPALFCLLSAALLRRAAAPAPAAPPTGGTANPASGNPAANPASPANPTNPANPANPFNPGDPLNAANPSLKAALARLSDQADLARSDPANPGHERVQSLSLSRFLAAVAASNIDLAAQRYNVLIAQAQLAAARVSPNPTLSVGTNRDTTNRNQPTSYSAGLTELVEVGGKRTFRTEAAVQNLLAASATVDDFFRNLRATAASAYVDAVVGQLTVQEKLRAYQSLNQLADLNQFRFTAGDLAEVDYNQARADALQARGDLYSSQSSSNANLYTLVQLLGKPGAALPQTVGRLEIHPHRFDLNALLARAKERRPDVIAARRAYQSAQASTRLARANRLPDVTGGVTYQINQASNYYLDPTPSFNSVNLSLSVPLPLFNTYRGEYLAALNTAAQAEKTLRSTELKAEVDVRGGLARYQAAIAQLAQYEGGALQLAEKVLQAKLQSYKQGNATLLDVLNAQRADTDVHLAALTARSERAKALIALEQAADLWDVDF